MRRWRIIYDDDDDDDDDGNDYDNINDGTNLTFTLTQLIQSHSSDNIHTVGYCRINYYECTEMTPFSLFSADGTTLSPCWWTLLLKTL